MDTKISTKKRTRTASEAYAAHQSAVAKRMSEIREEIAQNHRRDFEDRGSKDWGCVGDLAHVNEKLAEMMEFLGLDVDYEGV